jgi:PAS domain S-box-containing protein
VAGDSSGDAAGPRILLVGGSREDREGVRAATSAAVTAVESVAAARDALTADSFDAIVTELSLPDAPAGGGDRATDDRNVGGRNDSDRTTDDRNSGAAERNPVGALLEAYADEAPETPVVVYTAAGDERAAGRAVAAGAAGYVTKAEGANVLVDRLVGVLSSAANDSVSVSVDSTSSETHGQRGGETDAADVADVASAPADPAAIVEAAPLALVEVNTDNEIVRWNAGAEALFGYDESTVLGRDIVDLLVPADERGAVREIAERALSEGDVDANVNRNVCADGSIITCEWHNTTLTDADGTPRRAVSLVHDVTEREQRKETIAQLRTVTRELVRADSRNDIASGVVDAAEDILGQPHSAVYLADEDDALHAVASGAGFTDPPEPIPETSATWRTYESGEANVLTDDVPARTSLPDDTPMECVLVVPLGDHGTLSLGSRDPGAFDDTAIQLANILASATTAALDRTRRERDVRLHETVVDAVGAGVFALDTDGRFETVNDTLCTLTGYDRSELVGAHATTIVDEEAFRSATKYLYPPGDAADREEDVTTFEVDIKTADGGRFPAEVNVALLPASSESRGVAGVVRDVRERKEMETALGEKRRKVENLHDVASLLDDCETREDVWRLTVEAAEGLLDFDVCGVDEVRGDYLYSVGLSSEMEPEGFSAKSPVSEGIAGKTHRTGESFLIDDIRGDNEATPEKREYRSLISVPVGEHGVFQAVSDEVGAFDADDLEHAELLLRHVADAIDRIEFEDRLREERDRFAALFENVPDPVVQTTLSEDRAEIERVNPAFERVFGYDADDLVGEDLNEFVVPPDRREQAHDLDKRGVSGIVAERDVKRQTTDGLRRFDLTIVPVEPETEQTSAYTLYTDVTTRKERQKRVEILNRVLRHDLRNGMNIIKGSAEMLRDAVADSTAVGYADQVIERADDLLGLAEKTRAVERTLDRDAEATGPVSVTESVSTSVARVRQEYPHAVIDTNLEADVDVRADDMLHTAIYHVIENAVQHNDNGTPHVAITARIAPDADDMLHIEVRDDGPGIPAAERELIAEEQEITQLRHASGLGLWLVDWVVSQSGGEISFEENDPRGSVVTLAVPIATESDVVPATDD